MDVDEPVELAPYDSRWETRARDEIARLQAALAPWTVEIEHIGSTAVPGCAAKPIVDLLVGAAPEERTLVGAALEEHGYESLGEAEPGRLYLRSRSDDAFNAHVVERGGGLWRDNLLLREYLRTHPVARDRYVAAKREAAAAEPRLLGYSRSKSAAIAELLARARAAATRP